MVRRFPGRPGPVTGLPEDIPILDVRLQEARPLWVAEYPRRISHRNRQRHEYLIVILRVHHDGRTDLPVVRQTRRLTRLLPRLREDGEQNRGQDGYDRDDHEQLDERE